MNQNIAFQNLVLDKVVEATEMYSHVFSFAIKQTIYDVLYALVKL